jgi:hypothetical protein
MGWMGESKRGWSAERASSRLSAVQWQHHSAEAPAAGRLLPPSHCNIGPITQWQVRQTLASSTQKRRRLGVNVASQALAGRGEAGGDLIIPPPSPCFFSLSCLFARSAVITDPPQKRDYGK